MSTTPDCVVLLRKTLNLKKVTTTDRQQRGWIRTTISTFMMVKIGSQTCLLKFFLSPSAGRLFTAPSQHLGVREYQRSINGGAGSGVDLNRRMARRSDSPNQDLSDRSRSFARMMYQGKVKAALRLLSSESRGKVLDPDDIAVEGESEGALLDSAPAPSHPVVFEKLTRDTIRHAALHCQGAAGPSGLDASCWRRLCTMFHGASKQLCEALATATKRMCTDYIDPEIIRPFIACRLILLSKNPGVRPVGICDTLRRIVGKTILSVIGPEIQAIPGCTQLCARRRSGCEAAVHAMEELMKDESVEGMLLVDARNAFNSLNREVMLRNIQITCPSLAVPGDKNVQNQC